MKERRLAGFTLIEVMLTAVILSLGTVLIQEGLLRSASLLGCYAHTLKVERWMDEKIWETKELILYSSEGENSPGELNGGFMEEGKEFSWDLAVDPRGPVNDLYLVDLSVRWNEGNKPLHLTKATLVAKIKKIP